MFNRSLRYFLRSINFFIKMDKRIQELGGLARIIRENVESAIKSTKLFKERSDNRGGMDRQTGGTQKP